MNALSTQTGWRDPALAVAYLDGLSDPVVVVDPEARVREANASFLHFSGVRRSQLTGQLIAPALRHQPSLAPFVAAVEAMARSGEANRMLLNLGEQGQEFFTLLLTGVPLSPERSGGLLAVRVEDVTEMIREREESDAERNAANDSARALERLNEELEGFSYSVAHDLRAPLRFIDKFAYLLMEHHGHELSSEALQYAEQIREGSRQMAQLVEDLLQFSRVTGQELERERIDMSRLVRQVVAEAQYDIEDRSVEFRVGDLGTARGDPALVRQVLANLIGNAVKFTRHQEKAVIEITRNSAKEPAVYTVSDNGVGFDAAEADRLFNVFQRFHQPDDFEGSGVGLAVVKRVVNRHGGAAWAESRVGEGARFHFTLAPFPAQRGSA